MRKDKNIRERKVIHILTHSLSNLYPNISIKKEDIENIPYSGGWHVKLAKQIKKHYNNKNSKYKIECWSMEKKIDKVFVFEKDGIVYRIFPSKYFKYIGEISCSLLKELKREVEKYNILIYLHGIFNYMTFLISILFKDVPIIGKQGGDRSLLQKFLQEYRSRNYYKAVINLILYIFKFDWFLERLAFPRIDKFFIVDKEAEIYLTNNIKIRKEKLEKIPSGVDFSVFRRINKVIARETLGLEFNKKYILFVGAFVKVKGLDYLIKALPKVLKDFPNTTLLLIGDGYYKDELQHLVRTLRLENNVIFVPWVKNEILPLYYSAADVFVLPSLSEGLPVVGIEALACETPFIGTNVGGIPDIVKTFKAGILIPPKNPDAIANAVIKVLNGEVSFKVDRESAKKRFDWKNIVKRVVEVYEELFEKYYE